MLSLAEILEGELRHESEVQEVRKHAFTNAHYDRTTGLPNARLFSDRLEQALTISRHTQDRLVFVKEITEHRLGAQLRR